VSFAISAVRCRFALGFQPVAEIHNIGHAKSSLPLRLQPELDEAPDRPSFRWVVQLFAAREEHPFGTYHLYQRFVSPKSSLYPISRPTLVV
jgi:hypothetical protein